MEARQWPTEGAAPKAKPIIFPQLEGWSFACWISEGRVWATQRARESKRLRLRLSRLVHPATDGEMDVYSAAADEIERNQEKDTRRAHCQ